MNSLEILNRQKVRPIRKAEFKRLARWLLEEILDLPGYDLAVHLVSATEMEKANRQFLGHENSTDVITFDYRKGYEELETTSDLRGEILISVEDAMAQAAEFHTIWQEEIIRYFVHGVLHLLGYDDLDPEKRTIMKRAENKLLKKLLKKFPAESIG
jgi:probable rRNA maturation factor